MSTTTSTARERTDARERDEADLASRARAFVDAALARGADEAEAYAIRKRSVAVRYEKGDLKLTRVDDGTSVLDREPEEIDRRSTVSLALATRPPRMMVSSLLMPHPLRQIS